MSRKPWERYWSTACLNVKFIGRDYQLSADKEQDPVRFILFFCKISNCDPNGLTLQKFYLIFVSTCRTLHKPKICIVISRIVKFGMRVSKTKHNEKCHWVSSQRNLGCVWKLTELLEIDNYNQIENYNSISEFLWSPEEKVTATGLEPTTT